MPVPQRTQVIEADRAYARNLQAESNRRTKRHAFSKRFPQYLRLLVDMEPSCRRYFSYQALIVPGLLQTKDYMRTNARGWRPSLPSEQIDKDTENRLGRQQVLDNLNQQFWFVIDEAALRRTDGSLCRSKSRRCWSSGMSVLVDESAEDAGAERSAGVGVVYCGGAVLVCGW